MHRIFRDTVNPKGGNIDEIHGHLTTLMVRMHEFKGNGKLLDAMDYLWNEFWNIIILKKSAAYGPLVMKLIIWAWTSVTSLAFQKAENQKNLKLSKTTM